MAFQSYGHSIVAASPDLDKMCGRAGCAKSAHWILNSLSLSDNGEQPRISYEACDEHAVAFAKLHGIGFPGQVD